ncbi:hypothetical protein AB9P05_13935 [Roseivirga sp. BDSF3-8]|uniref:hypothetical protein n=1 Tax=Roseivirga sp. BDSF3-8 TaxID=3241598 RepID=UPI00353278F0
MEKNDFKSLTGFLLTPCQQSLLFAGSGGEAGGGEAGPGGPNYEWPEIEEETSASGYNGG